MDVVQGLRRCVRVLGNFRALSITQKRHFRYDDKFLSAGHSRYPKDTMESEERFDHRNDKRHYKNYQSNSSSSQEYRRRIFQDTMEHKRRQEQILQENKTRLQHRSDSKTGLGLQYANFKQIYAANPPGKRGDQQQQGPGPAREQRQKEIKRQERELRESRRTYDLPGYNRPMRRGAAAKPSPSKAWLKKEKSEQEQKYWHTWKSCPAERVHVENAADDDKEVM